MKDGIEFICGDFGLRAVLTSAWEDAFADEIRTRRCLDLEVNQSGGGRGIDLSFLTQVPWLKRFKVVDFHTESIEPIHVLHELRALEVITYCRTELRFSEFPKLEDCALEWRPGAESLFDCLTLKTLFVNGYKGRNLTSFSRLQNLESLAILNAPIESLEGICSLRSLRSVRLANLRQLRSLAGIESLKQLEELDIHACRRIMSIDELAALENLRILRLNDDGNISSLRPIDAIRKLESMLFYESTNIVDGDLSPLVRQKHLSRVSFRNRRHYSHRREDFGSAYTQSA